MLELIAPELVNIYINHPLRKVHIYPLSPSNLPCKILEVTPPSMRKQTLKIQLHHIVSGGVRVCVRFGNHLKNQFWQILHLNFYFYFLLYFFIVFFPVPFRSSFFQFCSLHCSVYGMRLSSATQSLSRTNSKSWWQERVLGFQDVCLLRRSPRYSFILSM